MEYLQAYEFKIVHRKGTSNYADDALSRPVLLCDFKEKLNFGKDIIPKYLDPYDDENLMHCSKQVNRIKRSSKNLSYDLNLNQSLFMIKKTN